MAILKCKMCGGDLQIAEGASVCTCEYCGSRQTIPVLDDEKKLVQFERAERLRKQCEFDKAAGIYETIVADFRQEAEAYWGLVLCKYGIEYVDDPATDKKIPTCHRSSFDSVLEDADLEQALENADEEARRVYRQEAKAIEVLRKGIISVSVNEQPYDIFICYKETDSNGERTLDSVLAQDMYDVLIDKGYRVFFSRISLEDKLGMEYEPYIFAALNSAKIMLAVGTDYEFYSAVWVKNEWSRFLKLMTKDKDKHLIPCYKGIDAYDMPREFIKLQAQDMGKVGAMQDLLRGIEKILGAENTVVKEMVATGGGQVTSLMKRAFMFLEDKDWDSADEYCEKVLDIDPECGEAYLGKLMVELRISTRENLQMCALPFDQYKNYQKAMRFGDDALQAELQGYVYAIIYRNEDKVYNEAVAAFEKAQTVPAYQQAAERFESIKEYKDAEAYILHCAQRVEELYRVAEEKRKDGVYQQSLTDMNMGTQPMLEKAMKQLETIPDWKDAAQLAEECKQRWKEMEEQRKETIYNRCVKWMDDNTIESLGKAVEGFRSISAWKDSAKLAALCQKRFETLKAERIQEQVRLDEMRTKRRKIRKIALILVVPVLLLFIFFGYPLLGYLTGDYALYIKNLGIRNFTIPEGDTVIEDDAFIGCHLLESVTIPDSVTAIGAGAFANCTSLTSVTIPDGVTTIGDHAFSHCASLNSVVIPDSVTSIGSGAFNDCIALESVVIPDSVTTIGDSAFAGCTVLESATIGSNVSTIGSGAFDYCHSLKTVTISEGVTTIGGMAFYRCKSIQNLTIPDSVTSIGHEALANCDALESVTIGDGVTTIETKAFYGCYSLETLTIPKSVTSIGDWVFDSCYSIREIHYGGTIDQWEALGVNFGFGQSVTVHCSDGVYTDH